MRGRNNKKMWAVLWLGSVLALPGCSNELSAEVQALLGDTAREALVAIGTLFVENAVDSTLD